MSNSLLHPLRTLARRRPLTTFFVTAYLITWVLWSPIVLMGLPVFDATRHAPSLAVLPGIAIGVTGTAFALTALIDGRDGVVALLRRLGSWRHGAQWYLVAILLLPMSGLLAALVFGDTGAGAALALSSLAIYPASYLAHFFFGPLFEETGWRGFALPRLEERLGPLRGTLVLSILWAGWHFFLYVPTWFADGAAAGISDTVTFTVSVMAMSFAFTWLSNNTGASLLLCILMHGSVDGTSTYFQRLADRGVMSQDDASMAIGLGALVGYVVVAVILLITTRASLGYRTPAADPGAHSQGEGVPRPSRRVGRALTARPTAATE
ncbi:type II CAAX endopeptidase family protein [Gordonia sp. L191]|uniref:type II CAAX endopeptidase family protein n=1 Tax=Gordonia sp. L191 TaxID=2982699 RepID=UPI0024BFD0DD|nr:type II CAAX endopeptidase family protein [Gordonia sp. L191]WHU45493.1 type II CAAX endopeptidase family protein [Gordonia sp. L191]